MVSPAKAAGTAFLFMLALGMGLTSLGYMDTIYALDRANALLSRAESAGFAEQMIDYLNEGRHLLPKEGNPVWIFPTKKTDFKLIGSDLESILSRAEILKGLDRRSDAYQQGMDDLKDRIVILEGQIREASPYLYASLQNTALALLWLAGEATLLLYLLRHGRRMRLERAEQYPEFEEEEVALAQEEEEEGRHSRRR